MPNLTSGDTFDGIDDTILWNDEPLDLSLVQTAAARILDKDGVVQARTLTLGPERGRVTYRMLAADYTPFPGPKHKYKVLINFKDGTQKEVPSRIGQFKFLNVQAFF